MSEYKVLWIEEDHSSHGTIELHETSATLSEWSNAGWTVVCVSPGTNAVTWNGLYVTLVRG